MKEKAKAKKQLGAELQNVKGGVARPGEDTAERKRMEEASLRQTHQLNQRMKELQCLFTLDELMKREDITTEQFFKKIIQFLPAGMQYPSITVCRITFEGKKYKTDNFKRTKWCLEEDIAIKGSMSSSLEVCYLQKKPEEDEGPFFREERDLIKSIAKQVAVFIEGKRAEEALRESEEKLRLTLESIRDGLIVTDLGGNIIDINDEAIRMVGYQNKEELIGRNALDFVTGKDSIRIAEDLAMAVEQGQTQRMAEYSFVTKDGREFYVEASAKMLRDRVGDATGFVAIIRDITERKRAEEALRKSEEYFKEITENSSDIIIITDKDGTITYCSSATQRFAGYKPEEIIGRSGFEFIHPDDIQRAIVDFGKAILTKDTAIPNSFRILHKDGSVRFFDGLGKNLLDHPSIAGFIMNIRDVTERKQAEEALRESLRRFELLTGVAGDLLLTPDPQELVEALCRKVMEHLDCHAFFNFLADEKAGRLHLNACAGISEEEARRIEWLDYGVAVCGCAARDGCRIVAENIETTPDPRTEIVKSYGIRAYACHPLQGAAGKVIGTLSFGTRTRDTFSADDLLLMKAVADQVAVATIRVKAYEALRETMEKLQTIFNSTTEGLVVVDLNGNILEVNEAVLRITGYSRENIIGRSALELIAEKDRDRVTRLMVNAAEGRVFINRIQLAITAADGTEFDGEFSVAMLRDSAGNLAGFIGAMRDITEQKRAQVALKASEEKYRELVENMNDVLYTVKADGTCTYISPAVESLVGYTQAEVIGQNFAGYIHPDDLKIAAESHQRVLSGESTAGEYRVISKTGEVHWVRASNQPRYEVGQLVGTRGILTDITERKRAEDAIRESEERLSALINNAPDAIYVNDLEGRFVDGNRMAEKLLGYSKEELIGKNFFEAGILPQEYLPVALEKLEQSRRSEATTPADFELIRKDGSRITLEIRSFPVSRKGKVEVVGIARDVTERKRAEEAIRESERRLKEAQTLGRIGSWEFDIDQGAIVWSDETYELYERDRALGPPTPEEEANYYAPEQAAILREYARRVAETGEELEYDLQVTLPSGRTAFLSATMHPLKDECERVVKLFGTVQDITERKLAEETLRESEKKYRELLESLPEMVIEVDMHGIVTYANQKAFDASGYTREDYGIGFNILQVVADENREKAIQGLHRVFSGGPIGMAEFTVRRKDGTTFPVFMHSNRVVDEKGNIIGLRAIAVDISQRKQAEMEREQLLHDLDERVRELNCLYGISNVLARQYATAEQLFQEILKVIISAWQYPETVCARIISEGGEYRTKNFRETPWKLSSDILARGEPVGAVEVYYLEERPEADEGPFQKAERDLINAVAGRLGGAVERKRIRDALRESEIRYRNLFEEAPASITVVDLTGMVIDCNEETEKLTGHARADILGKRFDELMTLDPGELPKLVEKFEKLASGEGIEPYEFEIVRGDDERRWIRVRTSLLRKGGETTDIQIYAVDITEEKMAEITIRESEERYRDLFEGGIEGMFVIDAETMKVSLCNKRAAQIYGYESPELAIGINPLDFVHPDDKERARRLIVEDMFLKDLRQINEFRTTTPKGEEKWISAVGTVVDFQGKPAGLVSFRDITEEKRIQDEIKRQTKRSEALYAITQSVSKTLDLDALANEALKTTLDVMGTEVGGIYVAKFESKELVLKSHSGVSREFLNEVGIVKLSDEELARGLRWTEPVFEPGKVFVEANLARYQRAIDAEGLRSIIIVPFWSKGVPQGGLVLADHHERKYSPEEIELLKAIVNEIAIGIENATLLEKTKEMSVTDELTGIYNRRHFYNELDTEIHRMQRYGRCLSIAMLDLDGFKNYNDTFGHASGDVMLRSIAQTLKFSLRKSDTVFRYGGDEFIVILPGTDAEAAKKVIDRIRSTWAEIHKEKHQKFGKPIGFSTGIAQFPDNANTPDGLVFLTDAALFYAKRSGGAQSMMASELNTLSPEILSMATREQVYALSATVDAKDPFTYGHSNRVAAIAETIAKSIGMSGKNLADVYAAAMLHDIGKLGVPDAILTKPSKLTDAEWKIIYQHPAEGAKIIVHVKELSGLIPMIRHHHEWYDGTGYPDRLKGDEIPLGARIISVADAYDTMTTKRLYRNIITPKGALKELERCSGSQFDPNLVQSFSRSMEKDSK